MFNGIFTAIVTPFLKDKIDEFAFEKLVKEQKESGVSGILISGTTGESPSLTRKEKEKLLSISLRFKDDNFKIMMGIGSNNTNNTIEELNYFENKGIDACLLITPYYNKPTQEGLYLHFKNIHNNSNIPIFLYNIPSRVSVSLNLDSIIKLSKLDRIIGIKEASSDMLFTAEIKNAIPDFILLSGDDCTFLPFLSVGGVGIISVVSNLSPKLMLNIYNSYVNNDNKKALEYNKDLVEMSKAIFLETNPIPIKTALVELNKISEEFRLPLTNMNELNRRMLRMTLRRLMDF